MNMNTMADILACTKKTKIKKVKRFEEKKKECTISAVSVYI